MLIAIIAIVVLLAIYVISQYNGFIQLRNKVKESFSTMDVYLKKRWDLIPNLVETVKGYAKHESSVLEQVVSLRSSSYDSMSVEEKIDTNQKLSSGVSKLIAVAESYPELKANENFADLSKQLTQIESEIANSRTYYNSTVNKFNNKVEMFPSNIIANIFNFKQAKLFEANETERNNVKVEF